MKKLLIALGLGALMMGTTIMALPVSPPIEGSNGLIVINEEGIGSCYAKMYVPGYDLPLIFSGTDVHVVSNKNMTKAICKLDIPEVIAGLIDLKKAYRTIDFTCSIWNYSEGHPVQATGQNFIWTPGNQARLECFYRSVDDAVEDDIDIILGTPI